MVESKQNQKAGDSSINIQAQNINIDQNLSYDDVKSISMDVFETNFYRLSHIAANTARERAEKLTCDLLDALKERNPEGLQYANNPDLQYAIFNAQKEYARSGDADLESLLIDILIERANHNEKSDDRIVLNESLTVAPKLNIKHLDALTVNFLLIRSALDFEDIEQFCNFIEDRLIIFSRHLTKKNSCYEHLEYANCGSIMRVARWAPIGEIIQARWPRLFNDANDRENCGVIIEKIKTRFPELYELFDVWENSHLSKFDLTTVGVSIAKANYRRIVGIKLDSRPPAIHPFVDGGDWNAPLIQDR